MLAAFFHRRGSSVRIVRAEGEDPHLSQMGRGTTYGQYTFHGCAS